MDFSRWLLPKKLVFSPEGKYLIDLSADFPVDLKYYKFSLPHPSIPNYHDFLEIARIMKGKGSFTIGEKEHPAAAGDVFVINSGVFHLLESPDPDFELVTLYFLPELIYEPGTCDLNLEYLLLFLNYRQGFNPKIPISVQESDGVLRLFDRISLEVKQKREFHRIAVKNDLCSMLLLLNRAAKISSTRTGDLHLKLRDIHRLRPVFDWIHQRFSQKISLAELAEGCGMSVTHLCRYFKKVTGKTITEYIKRYRIDKAKELLIEDERSITWIAYEVGFESHSYFDRIFHEVTRLTPQEFRRKFTPKVSV